MQRAREGALTVQTDCVDWIHTQLSPLLPSACVDINACRYGCLNEEISCDGRKLLAAVSLSIPSTEGLSWALRSSFPILSSLLRFGIPGLALELHQGAACTT